jgi:hypothetical protein
MKVQAIGFSETMRPIYWTAWCHIPEDSNFYVKEVRKCTPSIIIVVHLHLKLYCHSYIKSEVDTPL